MTEKKIKIGILLGGRSSEHEVSLMSARSIIQMLDPQKYQVTQIGITPAGQWLVGENVIDRMLAREYDALTPAALLPEPGESALYRQQITDKGKLLEVSESLDVIFPVLHGTLVKMAHCKACLRSSTSPTSAPGCWPHRSAWTKRCSRTLCVPTIAHHASAWPPGAR